MLTNYINEDIPYMDLTTSLQENTKFNARLDIFTKENIIVSGSEVAAKIGEILGLNSKIIIKSGLKAKSGDKILLLHGSYKDIHKAWKLAQVYLEYSCGIASYTNKMLNLVKEVNPKCQILGTRKTFPFSKKLCIKALLDGGGFVHRLNLSDSVLFFENHRIVYSSDDEFYNEISKFKEKVPEKKIVIEALNFKDAFLLMKYGADVVQLDKFSLNDTKKVVEFKDENYQNIKILSAGSINLQNAKDYAMLKVDAIVTSAIYQTKMADISAKIYKEI